MIKTFFYFLAALALAACSAAPAAAPTAEAAKPNDGKPTAAPSATLFTLVKPDGSKMDFSASALNTLPKGMVMLGGTPNEGALLSEALKAAGVADFAEVTLTGNRGSVTFKKAELTKEYILDFTNRGTVKPSWPNAPQPTTVGDVSQITVK
ncbi:MAG TPA: hypothetical protein PLW39_13495 [Thermoflexales bacterium]|nr:hypothetical protein [Thermoflexales bacterium]